MAYPKRNQNRKKEIFNPIAKFGKLSKDETKYIISVSGIYEEDIPELNSVSDGSFQFSAKATNSGVRAIFLQIKSDEVDNFLNKAKELKDKFNELKFYNIAEVDNFIQQVGDVVESTPNTKDIEKNSENISKTWRDLLTTLRDPKVRERFLLLQTTPTFRKIFKDEYLPLSKENVRRVLLSDPQATFVTNISTWRRTFNREVIDKSQFVIIKRVDNNKISPLVMNRLPEVKELGGWEKLSKDYNYQYDNPTLFNFIKKARITYKLGEIFFDSKVYDVRNTKLIPGMEDNFLKLPNLIDNLRGEINQAAIELKNKEYEDKNEVAPDFNERTVGTNKSYLTRFKNELLKMCENKGIHINETNNVGDTIVEAAYYYAYKVSTSLNILKEENKKQFAASLALVVAHSLGIDSENMRKYLSYVPSVHKDDVLNDLSAKIHGVYMQIMGRKSDVSESILNEMKMMTITDIKNFIKSLQKELVNESKNKILNLIERLEKR